MSFEGILQAGAEKIGIQSGVRKVKKRGFYRENAEKTYLFRLIT